MNHFDIAKNGKVIYLRDEAKKACRDGSSTRLKDVCAAALDTLDLVEDIVDELKDLDQHLNFSDPEKTYATAIEWKDRGKDALTRMKLINDGAE